MKVLSPQQQQVVAELTPIVEIATDGSRNGCVVTPRVQSLIVGPSGTGKSHVAVEIAGKLNVPHLKINVGSWILMASRTIPNTWTVIAEWLSNLKSGGIIILDEIDKLTSDQEYTATLRLEIHDLLDGQIPPSLAMPTEVDESFEIPAPAPKQIHREAVEKVLQNHVMIIACGAFQKAWRSNVNQMGFGAAETRDVQTRPSREQILSAIDPELRQRFREEIAILPPMSANDYFLVSQAIAAKLPPDLKREWEIYLETSVARAIEGMLGMRIFEELLLTAMIESRKNRASATSIAEAPNFQNLILPTAGPSLAGW